ncbi:Protein kinase C signaling pathway involved MAPKK protein [Coemansia sp. RSA 2049]|nr:Protein kinase C signaling pathway involved MAPKK protein [Coemansia sp. RSA 2049]
MTSLNRSNATSSRAVRPVVSPRLYTATTPRGQAPAPMMVPRVVIPTQPFGGMAAAAAAPRVQTQNLPPSSGDQAARQQSREVHDLGLSIITRAKEPGSSTAAAVGGGGPPGLTISVPPKGAAFPQPKAAAGAEGGPLEDAMGQLSIATALDLEASAPAVPKAAAAAALSVVTTGGGSSTQTTATSLSTAGSSGSAADDDDEYVLQAKNIKVMRKLGEGSVGTVYKVEYVPTKKIMARKVMAVYPDETNHRQIMRELRHLKQCQSPYIVKYYGAYFSDDDDGQSIAICMEYCEGGSLEAVYKRVAKLNAQIGEGVLGKVAVAVTNGLVHLHSYRIIHRDVKPSNILVTGRGEIKLCDFGVSGELVDSIAQTFVGTSYYMAPERIQGDRYAVQSDIWSLGLTLIEVSQNQFPFPPPGHPQLSVIELLEYIIHMPVPEMDKLKFSAECCDFVRTCLVKDPGGRPTPSMLLDHPFVVKAASKRLDLKSWIERVWGFKK